MSCTTNLLSRMLFPRSSVSLGLIFTPSSCPISCMNSNLVHGRWQLLILFTFYLRWVRIQSRSWMHGMPFICWVTLETYFVTLDSKWCPCSGKIWFASSAPTCQTWQSLLRETSKTSFRYVGPQSSLLMQTLICQLSVQYPSSMVFSPNLTIKLFSTSSLNLQLDMPLESFRCTQRQHYFILRIAQHASGKHFGSFQRTAAPISRHAIFPMKLQPMFNAEVPKPCEHQWLHLTKQSSMLVITRRDESVVCLTWPPTNYMPLVTMWRPVLWVQVNHLTKWCL